MLKKKKTGNEKRQKEEVGTNKPVGRKRESVRDGGRK